MTTGRINQVVAAKAHLELPEPKSSFVVAESGLLMSLE